jgi:hypothetical protein
MLGKSYNFFARSVLKYGCNNYTFESEGSQKYQLLLPANCSLKGVEIYPNAIFLDATYCRQISTLM